MSKLRLFASQILREEGRIFDPQFFSPTEVGAPIFTRRRELCVLY